MTREPSDYLQNLQALLSMPRETLPSSRPRRRAEPPLAAERLELEFIEIERVAPTFLLLPPYRDSPTVCSSRRWHAEVLPVHGGRPEARSSRFGDPRGLEVNHASVVVAPGSTQGSLCSPGS